MGRDIVRQNATDSTDASQALAIEALVAGSTVSAAAEQAGVSRATLHRWLASDHVFLAAFNDRKAEVMAEVRGQLRSLAGEAVAVYRSVLDPTKGASLTARLKVARAVLEMVGADTPERIGPSDPDKVQDELDPGGAAYRQILRG
jgi:AcrR family transcriptional regulator